MATDSIPGATPVCKAAASRCFTAACDFESLQLDAERLSETAFALATAETFDSNAQSVFYALGQLSARLEEQARKACAMFSELSRQHKGEAA